MKSSYSRKQWWGRGTPPGGIRVSVGNGAEPRNKFSQIKVFEFNRYKKIKVFEFNRHKKFKVFEIKGK